MEAPAHDATNRSASSQTVRALLKLRDFILSGELKPGDRISELPLVERLGVSRTPIRMALVRLEEEGLLAAIPSGGFAVKAFSERDIYDAIEVRGALEGLAARLAAERGVTQSAFAEIKDCLSEIDAFIDRSRVTIESFSDYVRLNARFHVLLLALADSPVLERQLKRVMNLPFASPSAFVMVQAELREAHAIMTVAQDQHRCVMRAIEMREGARAEAIMREHARLAFRNLELALQNSRTRHLVPGSVLIRRPHHRAPDGRHAELAAETGESRLGTRNNR
jgi:GntR family transcriptional regulator, vanillate catabolism transcriptional regulator